MQLWIDVSEAWEHVAAEVWQQKGSKQTICMWRPAWPEAAAHASDAFKLTTAGTKRNALTLTEQVDIARQARQL
jgi:hypothetical protein